MSETPKITKSEAIKTLAAYGHAACDRIEQLETELAESRKQLKEVLAESCRRQGGWREVERQLKEARAEIERLNLNFLAQESRHNLRIETKDKLVKQMRNALKIAAPCVKEIFGYHSKDYTEVKVALSAAERKIK